MHIGATPNGRRLMPVFTYGKGVAGAAAWTVSKFPSGVKRALARWNVGRDHQDVVADLIHRTVAQNALHMAYHEMKEIGQEDVANLQRHQGKCVFYFTPTDEWAPPHQAERIREMYPEATVHMCEQGIPHAFVLGHGPVMAEKVWGWIQGCVDGHREVVLRQAQAGNDVAGTDATAEVVGTDSVDVAVAVADRTPE